MVSDAKGVPLAYVHCRDDLQSVRFAHNHLTSDEARRIASGIAQLPEFMMQRKDFHQRGNGQSVAQRAATMSRLKDRLRHEIVAGRKQLLTIFISETLNIFHTASHPTLS